MKKVQDQARVIMGKREKDVKTAENVQEAARRGASIAIKKKTGVEGKLFGSVTAKDIAEAMKKALDFDLDRRMPRINEPIKMTGAYTVEAHLEKGVMAQVKLEIEEE